MADIEDFINLQPPSTLVAVDEIEPHIELPDTTPSSVMNTEENYVQEMELNSDQF